jgi:hypothetical protein
MTGCGQRPRETERASDPEEINVPAHDEQRIGRSDACHDNVQPRRDRAYSAAAA